MEPGTQSVRTAVPRHRGGGSARSRGRERSRETSRCPRARCNARSRPLPMSAGCAGRAQPLVLDPALPRTLVAPLSTSAPSVRPLVRCSRTSATPLARRVDGSSSTAPMSHSSTPPRASMPCAPSSPSSRARSRCTPPRWERRQWHAGRGETEFGARHAAGHDPKDDHVHRALRSELRETVRRGWDGSTKSSTSTSAELPRVASTAGDRLVGIGVSYPLHRTTPATIRRYGALRRSTRHPGWRGPSPCCSEPEREVFRRGA